MAQKLFSTFQLGKMTLNNRIVMAPMTRSRAIGNIPNELMAKYYSDRADAGLLISEGISPSINGLGYARIPGVFNAAQVQGWKLVTLAVHKKGGRFFAQLMHTGRVSHPLNMDPSAKIIAPSAIAALGEMWTDAKGQQPQPTPKEMSEGEIEGAIKEYADSAKMAIEAGFDGVELHGANGYLIDQFLNTASNHRKDKWGGNIENRARFGLAVATAVSKAIGAERVGIRISPYGAFNGMTADPQMDELYRYFSSELNKLKISYIHVVDHSSMGAPPVSAKLKSEIHDIFKGAYILSGGYDGVKGEADLQANKCDLVAFGRPFISNPDLVQKMKSGTPLKEPDFNTFYTPGEKGYTDY